MKNIINIRRGIILFIFMLMICILPIKLEVLAEENIEVNVTYGIDGKFKSMKEIPIIVAIKNNGRDFQGEVNINVKVQDGSKHTTYAKEISLASGSSKKLIIPINLLDDQKNIDVNIVDKKNNIVVEKPTLINSGRISEGDLLVGMLTDDTNGLTYFGDVSYKTSIHDKEKVEGKLIPINISEEIIGDHYKNIALLDTIIINNYDTTKLSPEVSGALKKWVEEGGSLILGTGVNKNKTLATFNDGFIEEILGDASSKHVEILGTSLNLDLVKINEGVPVIKSGEINIINSIKKRKGNIFISAYDLGLEPMVNFEENKALWSTILLKDKQDFNMNYGSPYEFEHILRKLSVDNLPSTKIIAMIFLIYALIIGVVVYFILKKLKRRDYVWIIVPIVSIIFGGIIYVLGSTSRLEDYVVNKINIIDMDEKGNGQVSPYIGVSAASKKDLQIKEPEGMSLEYMDSNNRYYYGNPNNERKSKQEQKILFNGNNTYYEFKDNAVFNIKSFKGSSFEQKFNTLETNLYFEEGELRGTVTNTLGSKIQRLVLVIGNMAWDLGRLEENQELIIDDKIKSSGNLQQLSGKIHDNFYDAKYNKKNLNEVKDEFKDFNTIFRILDYISVYHNTDIGKGEIIAVTDIPVNYELDLNSKSISEFNTSVIVGKLDLNFVNKNGQTEYPLGYFSPVIENSNNNGSISEHDFSIHDNIEATIKYEIDENLKIEEIRLNNKIKDKSYNRYEPFKGKIMIYNVNTSKFEEIDMVGEKEYKIKNNVLNYVDNDNVIKIKILGNEERGSYIPQISVKGRY